MINKVAVIAFSLYCSSVLADVSSTDVKLFQDASNIDEKYEVLESLATVKGDENPLSELVSEALKEKTQDAIYELAYACKGFNQQLPFDPDLGERILRPLESKGDVYAKQLGDFIQKRSLEKAKKLLTLSTTPRQRAIAFMCLAECYFAKKNSPKAMLYSVLSLATYPSKLHDLQFQFYLKEETGEAVSLLQTREEILDQINGKLDKISSAGKFRTLFDVETVLGLLPSYPLNFSGKMEEGDPLEVFLGFDDGYTKHGAVTILSSVLSADPNSRYSFKIIEDLATPISSENKEKLRDLVNLYGDNRFTLDFVPVQASDLPPLLESFEVSYWPRIIFYKLLIPQLSDGQSRSLWLDSDVIVRSDLHPLFQTDIKDAWFIGTRDVNGCAFLGNLCMDHSNLYLNVGVLLINNKAINANNGLDILTTALDEDPELTSKIYLPEQDILAQLYQEHIMQIGAQKVMMKHHTAPNSEWNWFAHKHPSSHWKNVHTHFSKIIHMEGEDIKPWKKTRRQGRWLSNPKKNNGVMNVYFSLRDMTAWPASFTAKKNS